MSGRDISLPTVAEAEKRLDRLFDSAFGDLGDPAMSDWVAVRFELKRLRELAQPETCLVAAIQLPDGRVIRGHRHHNCFATRMSWMLAGQDVGELRDVVQGFLTTRGRFVDRAEGLRLMRAAGWDKELIGGAELTSEDLY